MQKFMVFQSLWAMELRSALQPERSLEENLQLIKSAGFEGISTDWRDREYAGRVSSILKEEGMLAEGQCFPRTIDDLKPVLDNAVEFGVHHIDLQPDIRPRRVQDCLPLLEGWNRLAEEAGVDVYIETHRDRMTTDLHFTLDLLEAFPKMRLLGDISHYVVGREFAWPIPNENHREIEQILDNAWAFHGRVASREQVQIEILFKQHKIWLQQFLSWWEYGFRSWRNRAADSDTLVFTCELGPKPYAITGFEGEDTTDRWAEALVLRDEILRVWERVAK
ncbi:sugar phosphate isomerase/epimerase [Rhizobium sp. 18055]|uniref:sugar phosphate isomerase/epimerase family protein n=1 Tax=Rhizobium sp. 18055 TaxID=2681403 RepID=UPI00135CD401|nr:sugar phosphate isomerase/epimerase [Rhizobium sp. 18055]